jgi:flagellar basal-body rod modification protein FlgD
MAIPALAGFTPGATTVESVTGQLARQDFLQLLVTQLRNQDPLSPMNDREFIAQMAQLSTLEATTGLASKVGDLILGQEQTQALQLAGREVEFVGSDGETHTGRVEAVRFEGGVPVLQIGEEEVGLGWVKAVKG